MHTSVLVLGVFLATSTGASVSATEPFLQTAATATVAIAAPVFLTMNAPVPLRVLEVGTVLKVARTDGEWLQVEFNDPQYGPRTGWLQSKLVRIAATEIQTTPSQSAVETLSARTEVSPNAAASTVVASPAVESPRASSRVALSPSSRIPLFVRAAGSAGGFTDPSKDRQDSVKDLQKKVRDSKLVDLVSSEEHAVIVLEVLARETKRETNGWTAFSGDRQNKSYLTVRLIAGEYTTEFAGESGSKGMLKGYGAAAGKVVDQLEKWVMANRNQLLTSVK